MAHTLKTKRFLISLLGTICIYLICLYVCSYLFVNRMSKDKQKALSYRERQKYAQAK